MSRIFTYITCVCLFVLMSCEKPTDFEFPTPAQRLVVQSNFSPNRLVEVFVSQSEELSTPDTAYVAIGNATVEIYEATTLLEQLVFVAEPFPEGLFYRSVEFRPEVGIEYTIRVVAPGFGEVTAMNKIPMPVALTTVEIGNLASENLDSDTQAYTYDVYVEFTDTPDEENFYHLVFLQQKIITDGDMDPQDNLIEEPFIVQTVTNNNSFKPYYRGGLLISDEGSDGALNSYDMKFRSFIQKDTENLGKLIVELRTVSEAYFNYHTSLNNENRSLGPPNDEPVIIFNNIDEGYGIFAGYSTSADSISIIQ